MRSHPRESDSPPASPHEGTRSPSRNGTRTGAKDLRTKDLAAKDPGAQDLGAQDLARDRPWPATPAPEARNPPSVIPAQTGPAASARERPGTEGDGPGGWIESLRGWRDRILASPGFQRWAAAFPLTRPIALRRSRQVFDLCAGFVYSQTVLALIRLDVFSLLADGARTPKALAEFTGIPEERLSRLLGSAMALRLLRRTRSGAVALGPLGAPLVGNEALAQLVEHNVLLYHDLADPLEILRHGPGGRSLLNRYWAYAHSPDARSLSPQEVGPYSALMAASQPLVAQEILDAFPFHRHQRILDVGGGEGAFLEAVGRRHPHLSLTLFDLPAVAERGRGRLGESLPGNRVQVQGGDFFKDPLPGGSDLISLVRILHDHDDDDVLRILRSVRAALPPGGTVLVAEPMAGMRGAETVGAAYFSLYLLAMGQGRPREPGEYRQFLARAGFRRIRSPRPRSPVLTGVITARS
jgi:demethylspheroidene O-methyltransferase